MDTRKTTQQAMPVILACTLAAVFVPPFLASPAAALVNQNLAVESAEPVRPRRHSKKGTVLQAAAKTAKAGSSTAEKTAKGKARQNNQNTNYRDQNASTTPFAKTGAAGTRMLSALPMGYRAPLLTQTLLLVVHRHTHTHTIARAHKRRTMQPSEFTVATVTMRVGSRWHQWHAACLCRKGIVRRRYATHRGRQRDGRCSTRHRYAITDVSEHCCASFGI